MTIEEKIDAIISALDEPTNLQLLLRASIIESLTTMPEEQLDNIIADLELED